MADLTNQLQATAGATVGPDIDPNFNQTVLLLHGDGTNGAQNNTFLDGSTNNFTITRNGNTTQGTFSPFSLPNGEWSNYFPGTAFTTENRISGTVTAISTGNFTISFWVYVAGIVLDNTPASNAQIFVDGQNSILIQVNGSNQLGVFDRVAGSFAISASASTALPYNQWTHIALIRSGTGSNQTKLYINGSEVGSATVSSNFTGTSISIGSRFTDSSLNWFPLFGYISNFIYADSALSSAVPAAPNTNVSGTRLLTCQSNRFVDNSSSPVTLTVTSNVRVTPFSPFAPSAAYDPAVNGGSGYFDGSGDYLECAADAAFDITATDFTIEAWIYNTGSAGVSKTIATQRSGSSIGYGFIIRTDNKLEFYYTQKTPAVVSVNDVPRNQWVHVAATRSGTTVKVFINGVEEDSETLPNGTASSAYPLRIGIRHDTTLPFSGYISNFRLVKGTALYTGNFTPPTAPLTAITNTSLLCNFTNAGIFDNTGKNNLETVADAQIDTTTKKYGTGSMEFDGTGDWLLMAHNPDQQLGTGSFTIEFWVYLASGDTGSARGLVAKGTSTTGFLVSLDSSEKVVFTFTTSTITSSGAITTNAWNHIAVVREGTGSNQTKIYIGGTNDGTGTVSTDFNQTSVMYVGCNRTAGDPMKGFIDDLRITKGVARYTGNFTAPTKAFPDQ
jgi:hypothetical protein